MFFFLPICEQVLSDQLSQLGPLQAQIGAGGQIQLVRVGGNATAAGQPIILQTATPTGATQTTTGAQQPQQQASTQQQQTQHHAATQAIFLSNGQQVQRPSGIYFL